MSRISSSPWIEDMGKVGDYSRWIDQRVFVRNWLIFFQIDLNKGFCINKSLMFCFICFESCRALCGSAFVDWLERRPHDTKLRRALSTSSSLVAAQHIQSPPSRTAGPYEGVSTGSRVEEGFRALHDLSHARNLLHRHCFKKQHPVLM